MSEANICIFYFTCIAKQLFPFPFSILSASNISVHNRKIHLHYIDATYQAEKKEYAKVQKWLEIVSIWTLFAYMIERKVLHSDDDYTLLNSAVANEVTTFYSILVSHAKLKRSSWRDYNYLLNHQTHSSIDDCESETNARQSDNGFLLHF